MNITIKAIKYITAFCSGKFVIHLFIKILVGAPARSRTQNLLVRSQALYPIELQALIVFLSKNMSYLKCLSAQFLYNVNVVCCY